MSGNIQIHPIKYGLSMGFLIETKDSLFLLDCGEPGQECKVIEKMKELGRSDLKCIWITHAHYDHYGSAEDLRKWTGAKIGVHPKDAEYLVRGQSPLGSWHWQGFIFPIAQRIACAFKPLKPLVPDFTLEDAETLDAYGLDARVLFTPGHTPGHSCLELANGIVFAGDLISSQPWPSRQHLIATDWRKLMESLAYLKSRRPEWIYTGHSKTPIPGFLLQRMR